MSIHHYISPLMSLSSQDVIRAGGKGASLGEMLQAGIPVPDGYVVLSTTFDAFLHETGVMAEVDSLLGKVDHTAIHVLESVSEQIETLILEKEMPEAMQKEILEGFSTLGASYVAVRSSATAEDGAEHAWAGQLETFLNTTHDTLLKHVRQCRASLFSPRALFYRFEKGLHTEHISVAVVVQKMVQSEKSGIAFSVHPVTQDRNQLIIEAGFGLGEAIVSGAVTPDSYVVTKKPFVIEDIYVAEQSRAMYKVEGGGNEWKDIAVLGKTQVLSSDDILELAGIILTIERHYKFPCDIEWAYEGGQFYITQSRPITTLAGEWIDSGVEEMDGESAGSSAGMTGSQIPQMPHVDGGEWMLAYNRNLSFFIGSIVMGGYYDSWPSFGLDTHYRGLNFFYREAKNVTLFVEKDEYEIFKKDIIDYLEKRENMVDAQRYYKTYGKQFLEASQYLLKTGSLEAWDAYITLFRMYGGAGLILTGQIGRIGLELLQHRLQDLGYKEHELAEIVQTITYPKEHTPMFDAQLDLVNLGARIQTGICSAQEKEEALQKWLTLYGFIPVNFSEQVRTHDDAVEQLEEVLKEDCTKLYQSMQQNHDQKIEEAEKLLQKIGDEEVTRLAYALQDATYLNEYRKNVFCKISLEVQTVFKDLAAKLGRANREDFYYLMHHEVRKVLAGEKVDIDAIKASRTYICVYIDKEGALQVLEDEKMLEEVKGYVTALYDAAPKDQGIDTSGNAVITQVHGMSANRGVVTGPVKIVMNRSEFGKFKAGDILVTSMTSVDFVPIMRLAAGFVTNEGGVTSHASIVARELNKPCVIGTKNATSVFQDGDMVEVDANTGVVKLVSRAGPAGSDSTQFILNGIEELMPHLVKFATRPQTVQRDCMIIEFCSRLYGVEMVILPLENNFRGFYVHEDALKHVYDTVCVKLKDKAQWRAHITGYEASVQETANFVLSEDELRKAGNQNMLDIYAKRNTWLAEVFSDLCFAPFVVENYFDPEFRKLLTEKYGDEQGSELFAAIASPGELIEYQKMRLAIYEKKISGETDFQDLVDEFGRYSEYTYLEPLLTAEDFHKELDVLTVEEAKQEREKLLTDLEHNRAGYAKAIQTISDPYLLHLAEVIHTYTFLRTDRVDQLKKRQVQLRKMFTVIAEMLTKETDVQRDVPLIVRLLNEEIVAYLQDGVVPSLDEINKRNTENYIMRYDKTKIHMLYGEEHVKKVTDQIHAKERQNQVIKGTIAFKGKHIGKVVKVLSKDDLGKVQQGDVLVSRTTQPDFTPAMQKAGAIVTDEGGITSHAAIVSREIKTPCIVGTKTATLLLNDGDMVEVDAEQGVVHILSKAGVPRKFVPQAPIEKCNLLSEGGRACWTYIGYVFGYAWHIQDGEEYPNILDGLVINITDHIHKRNFLISDEQKFITSLKEYLAKDSACLAKMEEKMTRHHDRLIAILQEPIVEADLRQLQDICARFFTELQEFGWTPAVVRLRDRGVRGVFNKYFEHDAARDEKIADLSITQHLSFLGKEEVELLRLANKQRNGEVISELEREELVATYAYTTYGYYVEEPRSLVYYKDKVQGYANQDSQAILEEMLMKHEKELLARDALIYTLPNELVPFALAAGYIPYLKDLYKYYMNHVLYEAEKLFNALSRMFTVSKEILKDYTWFEIMGLFEGNAPALEMVQKRAANSVLVGNKSKIEFLLDGRAEEFREKRLQTGQGGQAGVSISYKGRTACKGRATGKAKIILSPHDFHKFEKGDILVAMNTSPDFVAIMSMASAIVAEDGGITAHVSVVSRELGIPCVVGIGNITSVLEDGDEVEVNANEGIVTKK